ncbi:hypothetical protein CL2_14690 [Anaerostipes hadrus]|uniref:Uncharacterized protein n=1 Tax=Anaerostipes hadrus TaxID=649756 RepID=D4N0M0_ANAHA|nr:hypothetical protein [Anaerostipes hadrus]EDS21601.1 hypothetical protein CLOSS21_01565 [Clostridium sp. SS2/1]CBL38415.1 hypothetical protein CL2_14690 [Anaerostipes hadrus]
MKKNECYVVNFSDGYEIMSEQFKTYDEAYKNMSGEYNDFTPEEPDGICAEMSYLDDYKALLYCNGNDVYCWNICKVTF